MTQRWNLVMRMNKQDIRNIIIIILVVLGYILATTILSGNTYISQVDFISQHFRISEYFKTLFYKTGNLFPNFAPHLEGAKIYFTCHIIHYLVRLPYYRIYFRL